jgi:hypothetical protein
MTGEGREDQKEVLPQLSDEEVADVEVFTSVRADELRFETVPETKLTFEGEPAERSSSKAERENLPDEVESGVTYRDITVRWQARSRVIHPSDPSTEEDPRRTG